MGFCEDLCAQTKSFCTYNNNIPWFTLRKLCQSKEEGYSSRDQALLLYKQARNKLSNEIRVAKRSCNEKLKNQLLSQHNPALVWSPAAFHQLRESIHPTLRRIPDWLMTLTPSTADQKDNHSHLPSAHPHTYTKLLPTLKTLPTFILRQLQHTYRACLGGFEFLYIRWYW